MRATMLRELALAFALALCSTALILGVLWIVVKIFAPEKFEERIDNPTAFTSDKYTEEEMRQRSKEQVEHQYRAAAAIERSQTQGVHHGQHSIDCDECRVFRKDSAKGDNFPK
jgi:hypothetical protein